MLLMVVSIGGESSVAVARDRVGLIGRGLDADRRVMLVVAVIRVVGPDPNGPRLRAIGLMRGSPVVRFDGHRRPTDASTPHGVAKRVEGSAMVSASSTSSRERSPGAHAGPHGRAIGWLAGGVAGVAILGGVAAAWRLWDQRVLRPGTGPAYEPWHADLRAGTPLALVRAAVLASSAHDIQPWRFRITDDSIELLVDEGRSLGALDPLGRERDLGLGAALEHLVLAGPPNGYAAHATILPDDARPDLIARVALTREPAAVTAPPATAPPVEPLFDAIPHRHTDRTAWDTSRTVTASALVRLAHEAVWPAHVVWLSGEEATRFGDLTVDATTAIVEDAEQATADAHWYRQDWHAIERDRDGITIDTVGLPSAVRVLLRWGPPMPGTTLQRGWVSATRDRHVRTASAFGVIVVRDPADRAERIAAGRSFARLHLRATLDGVAVQPLNQLLERVDRERATGHEGTFTAALHGLLPAATGAVMAFRVGYSKAQPTPSPRRPAEQVIVA